MWELILAFVLIFLGILFILLEALVPGGILGILGAIAMAGGVALAFNSSEYGYAALAFAVVGAIVALILVFKVVRKSRLGRSMVLDQNASADQGYVAQTTEDEAFVGRVGQTVTMCRPAGIATFDGRRVDVVADGMFIEAGVSVKVIAVDGNRMVVAAIENTDQT
jgi:membrane-bound serine protease (ClpP class)